MGLQTFPKNTTTPAWRSAAEY